MRLVDADALDVVGTVIPRDADTKSYVMGMEYILNKIDSLPTIEERKTGKWIEKDDGWDGTYYECSCCKEAFTLIDGTPSENMYNYCPNCGARMEEDT